MRREFRETYKILTGLDRADSERMFPMLGESRTRGRRLRISGKPFTTEMRRDFFTQRVVNVWNSLPPNVVEAETLSDFKRKLDIALETKGIKGYGGKTGLGYCIFDQL